MSNGAGQYRRWTWTLNNYTDAELAHLRGLEGHSDIRYLLCGIERGQSGTPHLQGYVEFKRPKRLGGVKKLLGSTRIHAEDSKADSRTNQEYCKKEGNVAVEFGSPGGSQGKRTDLDRVAECIRSGMSAVGILEECPTAFIKYTRGIEKAIQLLSIPRRWKTTCVWRYGHSGTGKSRDTHAEAERFYPGRLCWVSVEKGHFFNGLQEGCKGVILDEFDGTIPIATLLRLVDRYPYKVAIKGAFVDWKPNILWITSQFSPEFYYKEKEQWPALERRLAEYCQVFNYEWDINWETGKKERRITERVFE